MADVKSNEQEYQVREIMLPKNLEISNIDIYTAISAYINTYDLNNKKTNK